MKILPHKLTTTNDQLTARAGLLTIAQVMQDIQLAERVDTYFPQPGSNRGFKPSVFVEALVLLLHEGGNHLDDVRHLHNEKGLMKLLGMKHMPSATALGKWLRRMGKRGHYDTAWTAVNRGVLQAALHQHKGITLDIDATEVIAGKHEAQWTYKGNKGYMPMVGHVAETGQVVACDFRSGNTSPAKENLEFIQQCEQALPQGCFVQSLRIDAAGFQQAIFRYCEKKQIQYAIRARMSAGLWEQINALDEQQWQPLQDNQGQPLGEQSTCRLDYWMGDLEKPLTLIIQRQPRHGQQCLQLEADDETGLDPAYLYRAIATNRTEWSDSRIIHWYNQRAEDSENRIKELKADFGADTLPCSDFHANALYFLLCALAYNLFALMRQLLPEALAHHRAITLRWRLYALAGKIVKTGRQWFIKLQASQQTLLSEVLIVLKRFESPPI